MFKHCAGALKISSYKFHKLSQNQFGLKVIDGCIGFFKHGEGRKEGTRNLIQKNCCALPHRHLQLLLLSHIQHITNKSLNGTPYPNQMNSPITTQEVKPKT
jgi:hypothetical protein